MTSKTRIKLHTYTYVPPPTVFAAGSSFSVMSRISITTTMAMDNARRINSKKKIEIKANLAVLVNPMLHACCSVYKESDQRSNWYFASQCLLFTQRQKNFDKFFINDFIWKLKEIRRTKKQIEQKQMHWWRCPSGVQSGSLKSWKDAY